jgi:hypothetical protein
MAIHFPSVTYGRKKQLISSKIEKVNDAKIADAQAELRPALESPMGKRFQATTKVADAVYNSSPNRSGQIQEN